MSEPDRPYNADEQSPADRTLLGVAPPKLESAASPLRSPVFVRSGTSVADVEPLPLPRRSLPSHPARPSEGASEAPVALGAKASAAEGLGSLLERSLRRARAQPGLWMVLAPALIAAVVVSSLVLSRPAAKPAERVVAASSAAAEAAAPSAPLTSQKAPSASAVELASRPLSSLSSAELVLLAEERNKQRREAGRTLRQKLERNPALAQERPVQGELLRLVDDADTASDGLAAMASLAGPISADLLYEVWTGSSARTDATELARALVYSTDVRPKASAALSVALELRTAESCEQYRAVLPQALKAGDRRSLHLLTKLSNRRGCGPKKAEDCYACLREPADELAATINAVKSRRAPSFVTTP
jgi:hypothetical protein